MKIKFAVFFVLVLMLVAMPVGAQPAHPKCAGGTIVFIKISDKGYAPRPETAGSQNAFDCIKAYDSTFDDQYFPTAWQAYNYWLGLVSQDWGVYLLPLPAPTN